jgi:RHS repeat-associated protein
MGRTLRCLFAILFLVVLDSLSSLPVDAQNYLYGTGSQTWGINIPIENGFINVANGQVHLEITLANHAQRGSLSLNEALVYDSRIWQIVSNGSSYSFQPTNVSNSQAGWRFVMGNDPGSTQDNPVSQTWPCSQIGGAWIPQYNNIYFSWTDPSGAVHQFPGYTQQPMSGVCIGGVNPPPNTPTLTGYAADGSGYYISVTNYTSVTIFDPNGNAVSPAPQDRNGNYFSTDANGNLIDTLGRTPVLKTVSGNLTYYDVLTIGGATKRYTVTTETINVHTAFGQSAVNEYSGTLTAIQSIALPDGSSYRFNYDSGTTSGNYGQITSITLPTGGTVNLGYQNYLDSYQNQNRWLYSYSGGKGSYTFAPQVVTQCTGSTKVGCQERMTVTDGAGNQVVYLLTLNNGAWNSQMDFYNATSLHVMSTATSYNISTSCQTYNCNGAQWITASSVTTTLSDTGQMAQTKYTYANPAIAKPTKVQLWDYYTGSPSTTPTKETDYIYGYYVNGAAFVTQMTQLNSAGTQATQTTYVYDYGTTNGCPSGTLSATSGLPHHQSVSGARGNLTCAVAGIAPTTAITTSAFDDAGTKLSDTDANGNLTSYATMCSDAFVQTVTYPVVVSGTNLRTMTTYDCPSGLALSSQDMNGVVSGLKTNYQYFTNGVNIGRLQTVSNPDGGGTTYSYPSFTETDQLVKQTSSVNATNKTILDTFGRPYQSTSMAPEGPISSETSYDATGKPSCVSTAHLQGTSSGTDGSTCSYYDVLGRVTEVLMPDGNFTTSSYNGASQTTTDELGHQKKYTYDAFHRLTKVLEPDSSGTLSYETDYTYDAVDRELIVDQWGGANGATSPGERKRLFAFDSLGRKVAENIPENQGSTSPASLTCQNAPSGTKWTMCFSFDGNGNTTGTVDNAGNSMTYTFDGLNRPQTARGPGINYVYGYDVLSIAPSNSYNLGWLVYASNSVNADEVFSYDSMGRLIWQSSWTPTHPNHTDIIMQATYDLAGNKTSLKYPDGRVVGQSFDSANRFNGVQYVKFGSTSIGTPYFTVSSFTPPGQPTSSSFGNGVGITSSFIARQSVAAMSYTNSSGTLWSRGFIWDKNGANLLLLKDNLTGNGRQFGYDTLNRIASAQDVQLNPTPSNATLSISGSEQSSTFNPCPPNVTPCWQTIYDGGSDTVNVNGVSAGGFGWGSTSTSSSLAASLASNINSNSNSPVTATPSGSSVTLTSKASGVNTNYGITVTSGGWNTYFNSPSFTVSAPSSMSGGSSGGTPLPGGLNESYGYDPFGNLTQSGNFGFSQSFNSLNQMSAGFNYDAKGEETTDIFSHPLAYDALGELLSTSGTAETYTYDTDGNRVEVKGSTTTDFIYFDGLPISMLSGGNYTDLIYAGGTLIAEVGGTASSSPTYRATDNLASLAGFTPNPGPITGAVNYAPYGQLFTGSTTDAFGFTGLEWDPTTALWHAAARQFSPQQGRWMSPDPYEGSYNWADPQSLNRYAYVNGMPTWGTDPTGTVTLPPGVAGPSAGLCGAAAPVCGGILAGIGVAEGIYDLGKLLGWWGSSFHGSLQPRPNAPWSEHMGGITSLGAPVGTLSPLAGIGGLNQAIGLQPGAGCEFGACGSIPGSSFSRGTSLAGGAVGVLALAGCEIAEPCGLIVDIGIVVGGLALASNITGDRTSFPDRNFLEQNCQQGVTVEQPATGRAYRGGTSIEQEFICPAGIYTVHWIVVGGKIVHGPHVRPGPPKGGGSL